MTSGGDDFDVVVVGGGPAGLATAAAAAGGGLRVLVCERGHAIGEPVRTSGGSFIGPLRALGVPDRCWHPVRRIRVVGPSTEAVKSFDEPLGCVLDVRATYQWLAGRAVDAGAEIRLKASVDGLLEGAAGGSAPGVRARDPFRGRYDVRAGVVVDASGHAGFLARAAGLRPGNDRSAVGMEVEVRAPRHRADEAVFWLGGPIVPGGYGWAFPCGDDRVRVGVGVVRPDTDAEPRVLLERLLDAFPAADLGAAIELHSGLMPVIAPRAATLVADGLLVVGDAAGQGSTLLGEGIRYAIAAGRIAGETLVQAGRAGFTARAMSGYPREWHRRSGRDLKISYAVNRRICGYGDDEWDRAIRRLERLTPKQAAHVFASDFSLRWAAGVLWRDPGLVRSVARGLSSRASARAASSPRAPSP